MNPDRRSNALAKWLGVLVGIFTVVGTLVGAGITFGQHMHADTEQDRRLSAAEERIRVLEGITCADHTIYCSTVYSYKEK